MRPARIWGLWICLALGLGLAVLAVRTPSPRPAAAPAEVFSAGRAMPIVREIAREPHPVGSAANARVRDGLLARMTALGLQPQVQSGVGIAAGRHTTDAVYGGRVENLVGVLPGRDRGLPALLLMAHYDSVPGSPGAADDATGVASVLEAVRALRATGPHARDVIAAITDGEEAGLLGAELFFRAHPLVAHVGAVINLEARGDAGRVSMFETGPRNGAMVRLFARAAERPYANSLTGYVYRLLPNDTDFTHVVRRGLPGLNLAFLGDQLAYHTALSTPDHLDQGSLQHMGGQALGAARALADAPVLPAKTADLVYSDVLPGLPMLSYPPAWGWAPVLLAAVLLAAALWRSRPSWGELGRGFAGAVAAVTGAVLALGAAGALLAPGGMTELRLYHLLGPYDLLFAGAALITLGVALAATIVALRGRAGPAWAGACAVLAVVACAAAARLDVMVVLVAVLAAAAGLLAALRPTSERAIWAGAVGLGVIAAAAAQALAPPAAILFAWPALAGAVALAGADALRRTPTAGGALVGVLAVLTLAVLGGWAPQLFAALGPVMPGLLALFVLLLQPTLTPLATAWATSRRAGAVAGAALAIGAASLAWAAAATPTVARPALTRAAFLADPGANRFERFAPGGALDRWQRAALGGGTPARGVRPPLLTSPVWLAPAPAVQLTAPGLSIVGAGDRSSVIVTPSPSASEVRVFLRAAGGLRDVRLEDLATPLQAKPDAWAMVGLAAPGGRPLHVDALGHGLEVVAAEARPGWPVGQSPPAKPRELMGSTSSDLTWVLARGR